MTAASAVGLGLALALGLGLGLGMGLGHRLGSHRGGKGWWHKLRAEVSTHGVTCNMAWCYMRKHPPTKSSHVFFVCDVVANIRISNVGSR